MIPYEPAYVARLLRHFSPAMLATATPRQFQLWPAQKVAPSKVLSEMIRYEKARRGMAQ